jgi:ribosomal protein S27E
MSDQETTYLYDHGQRSLYESHLVALTQSRCIFTRQVTLYLNHLHEPDKMPFFAKHLVGCRECREKVEETQRIYSKVTAKIPCEVAGDSFVKALSTQLELIEALISDKKKLKQHLSKKELSENIRRWFIDATLHTFVSATFIKGLLLAVLSYIILYIAT